MFYVYILQSERDKSRYTGVTSDLKGASKNTIPVAQSIPAQKYRIN